MNTKVPVPGEIINPSGLLGEIADYIYHNSYIPNRMVAYSGAIACMSYLIGARYRTPDGVYPGVYMVLLGKSGSGKDAAFKTVKTIIKKLVDAKMSTNGTLALLRKGTTQKISTRQGIEDKLSNMDARPDLLIDIDEIGKFVQSAIRGNNDHAKSFTSLLVEAYNTDSIYFRDLAEAGNNKKRERDYVDHPSFTVVGATNMMSLSNGIGIEQVYDGFINRFMWFDIDPHVEEIRSYTHSKKLSSKTINKLYRISKTKTEASSGTRSLAYGLVNYENDSDMIFVKYDNDVRKTEGLAGCLSERVLAFKVRVALQAKKLAVIMAVCENRKKPVITVSMAKRALKVVDWTCEQAIKSLSEYVIDNDMQRIVMEMKDWADTNITAITCVTLSSLYDIPSYRAKDKRQKAALREEFMLAFGDEYGVIKFNRPGRGVKPMLIYRRGRKMGFGKNNKILNIDVFKKVTHVTELKPEDISIIKRQMKMVEEMADN